MLDSPQACYHTPSSNVIYILHKQRNTRNRHYLCTSDQKTTTNSELMQYFPYCVTSPWVNYAGITQEAGNLIMINFFLLIAACHHPE
jgi:hypothetical protein